MQTFTTWMNELNSIVWGPAMLVLILGTGFYLQLRLGACRCCASPSGLRLVWSGRGGDEAHGEVSPFSALMTCLAATIGVGNIAGVATAIALGGPGAVFWMWMTALVGMATKYAEVLLAVHFRERDVYGRWVGGPMYAIRNGLGKRWAWLGTMLRGLRRNGGFRHRQHGAGEQHRCRAGELVRHQPGDHGHRADGDHRRGDPRRHQAHRRGVRMAGAVHGDRLRRRRAVRAGISLARRSRMPSP